MQVTMQVRDAQSSNLANRASHTAISNQHQPRHLTTESHPIVLLSLKSCYCPASDPFARFFPSVISFLFRPANMGLVVGTLQVAAVWILLQLGLDALVLRVPSLEPIGKFMKKANKFFLHAGVTFCALLVLLPSFVFVVLEVFGYVRQRIRSLQAKTLPEYIAHGVDVLQGMEVMGERIRGVALSLTADVEEPIVR
jgi:hypothetical protein